MFHSSFHHAGRRFGRNLAGYTRVIGLSAILGLASSGVAFSQPDIIIKDCVADIGTSGNPECYNTYFLSPDIWVRNSCDGGTLHENPIAGGNSCVYVKLTNIGNATLGSGVVHLYFGAASTSLSNWPQRWISYYQGTQIYGDEIGSACVTDLCPGCTVIVEIPWNDVPSNVGYDHFCLLARFKSNEDPMQVVEGPVIQDNTRDNNNIAWKNLYSIRPSSTGGTYNVYNGRPYNVETTLRFDAVNDEVAENWLQTHDLLVGLTPELFQKWQAAGGEGDGIEIVEEGEEPTIRISGVNAALENIGLAAGEEYALTVTVDYRGNEGDDDDEVVQWLFTQHEGPEKQIGGIGIDIYPTDEADGRGKAVRREEMEIGHRFDLKARPNIANAGTTIGFTLSMDTRASLEIYDGSGQLVRVLLSDEEQRAGNHEIIWDGTLSNGTQAPSGTYFYRLETPEGTMEKQIKIVR